MDQHLRFALWFTVVAGTYAASAVAGLSWSVVPGAGTSVWPAAGIAFAALILGGLRLWPAVAAGRLITAIVVGSPTPLWADMLIAGATTLGAVVPAAAALRFGGFDARLGAIRDVAWLVLGGGLAGGVISATLGCLVLFAAGTPPEQISPAWLNWSSGFFVGAVTVGPLVLTWGNRRAWLRPVHESAHLLACLAVVGILCGFVFLTSGFFAFRTWHVLPVLVWSAVAFGVRGTSAALCILSVLAITGSVLGTGPFATADADPNSRVLLTQQFIAVCAVTSLFLAAAASQSRDVIGRSRLAAIVSTSPEAILSTDAQGRIQTWNAGAERLFGWTADEVVGHDGRSLLVPPDAPEGREDTLRRVLAGEAVFRETVRLARSGERIDVSLTAAPLRGPEGNIVGASSVIRDIRDRKRAESALRELNEQLEARVAERTRELEVANRFLREAISTREAAQAQVRQLQKMEAVGQLTGGLAHDFNNMLAVITGSLDLARRRVPASDAKLEKLLDAAAEGADRAAKLTARLLAFSRQQPLAPQNVDVNRLVSGMSELLRRTLGQENVIETVHAGGLWTVHVDPAQLESAILNLAVNARDAMPSGGRLTVETANAHLDDAYAEHEPDVVPGQYVLISVTDSGSGMEPEVLQRAFDPFFTTKNVGKGTGLGLSMVYGFVKQSGGHVKIYSEVGHGTTVKVYLPRWFGAAELQAQEADPQTPRGAAECILVVEDEAQVRMMSMEMLTTLGYRAVEADSAQKALAALQQQPDIDVLFTDVVMPETNGRKLAEMALALKPDLKVLYTTGYTRNAVVHNGVLDPGVALLSKPFTLQQLAKKLRSVLERS